MQFVATNIFLRYLAEDDPAKTEACYKLFKKAEINQITLMTSEAVITEVVYVLASKRHYQLDQETIKDRLYPLLSLRGLKLLHRQVYLRALDLYALYRIDFEDCLTIVHMKRHQLNELYSYDRDFDQVPVIKRLEPSSDHSLQK